MRCFVDGINHTGEGIGRIKGKVAFIPYAIPGETVEIKIVEDKRNFIRASLEEVIVASPDRVEPLCPYYYQCGGCSYQHVDYGRQLELKKQVVSDSLKRIGGLNLKINPVLGMGNPWNYRNKVKWHVKLKVGEQIMGYYSSKSHSLIDIDACLLISWQMEDCSRFIKDHLNEFNLPEKCEITMRQSGVTGKIMVIFTGSGTNRIDFTCLLNRQEAVSVYSLDGGNLCLHYGQTTLPEQVNNIEYKLSPLAFFQINNRQNQKLIQTVQDYACLSGKERVMDAYCGTGTIALALAGQAQKVVGVEIFKSAIKDAKKNARQNNISNCTFIAGACEQFIPQMDEAFEVLVLNPPRAGCKPELIKAITEMSPPRIIYVSCNPATLARDLSLFVQADYIVGDVQPIDMFPHTAHVECVIGMQRKDT